MINQGERIKAFKAEVIDLDEKKGIVRAYINKFNVVDTANEMSMPGSFRKTFSERLKKMWWLLNHDWDKSLGVTLALEEDNAGPIATGRFNMNKQVARDTFEDYKLFAEEGRSLQHSVRVVPIKYTVQNDVLVVTEWMMKEWSTLTRPGAIEDTPMLSLKHDDEKFKSLETQISELKALVDKAGIATLKNQPPKSEDQVKQLIDFVTKLKIG